jgi:hypothetical protein
MTDSEELEELKERAREMVILFKTVRDEVEHQFSELSREERRQIFSLISPLITDMFAMAASEGVIEDITKPSSKRKKRRRV